MREQRAAIVKHQYEYAEERERLSYMNSAVCG